jgi:hypothetical protein
MMLDVPRTRKNRECAWCGNLSGKRGGIHNSVTRAILKPTHMIGGYAQQAYGFNYYGTVGSNRDEYVVVRKMNRVDWMDEPAALKHTPADNRYFQTAFPSNRPSEKKNKSFRRPYLSCLDSQAV